MKSIDGVSDIMIPLGIQKLGATAANPAAVNPTHGPATARPSNPTHSTTAAPRAAIVRSGDVTPWRPTIRLVPPRSSEVMGGWARRGEAERRPEELPQCSPIVVL